MVLKVNIFLVFYGFINPYFVQKKLTSTCFLGFQFLFYLGVLLNKIQQIKKIKLRNLYIKTEFML